MGKGGLEPIKCPFYFVLDFCRGGGANSGWDNVPPYGFFEGITFYNSRFKIVLLFKTFWN